MTLAVICSGAAGLIFQIAWLYECGLVFGNSLWSATIVLSSFMGGLALGNALVARFARRIARPFAAYAALEGAVGIGGVLLTYALPHLTSIVSPLTSAAGGNLAIVNVIRLAAAFAVLAIPATAMGATLPVLVGALSRGDRSFGRVLGHLYGWNTLGAVAGVLGAELTLVRLLGVRGSGWTACLLDLAAAALALRAASTWPRSGPTPSSARARTRMPAHPSPSPAAGARWALLVSACLAGAVLLALEVVWFRFLTMYVLSTTLTVSLMLASVLAAIGGGGLVASMWLERRPDAHSYAATIALLAGCATVASYAAFGSITSGTQVAGAGRVLWMACALTAPTSFLSGVLFTLLGAALERATAPSAGDRFDLDDSHETRATAALTLANTAGAMCGPPLAAFVLLPALGMEGAFFALAFTYLAVAAAAFRLEERRKAERRAIALAVVGVAFFVAIVQFPFGAMRNRYFLRAASAYAGDGSAIVATREGASDTVFLMQQAWLGQPVYDRLVTDGFSMSGTAVPGRRYMRAFAYWPMLLHQAPLKRALVVCYGVGVTAQAVEDIASVDSIDVVEISPDVVAMSDVIYQGAKAPLRDPRVRLHLEDGRNFLQTTDRRFDLITGEPPPPRTPGTVSIYTREYFQLIYDRLAEGGITTYWVPVARPSPGTDVDTVIRAFCDVFADCSLWNATPFDFMLVGSRGASGPVSEEAFGKPWVTPGLEARLRDVGFEEPQEIGATFLGDAAYLHDLTRSTPPLVDDFPQRLVPSPNRPSLSDPRYGTDPAVASYFARIIDPARAKALFLSSPAVRRLLPESLIAQTAPAFEYQRIINRVLWDGGKPLREIEDLHWTLTETRLRTLPLWILGSDDVKQRIAEASGDTSGAVEYARGLRALTGRGYAVAAQYFAQAEQRGLVNAQVRGLRAYSLLMAGQVDEVKKLMPQHAAADADEGHFWEWIRTRIASGASAS